MLPRSLESDTLRVGYCDHVVAGNCGLPGTKWYWAIWDDKRTSWCAVPGDSSDVAEPVRAVAEVASA